MIAEPAAAASPDQELQRTARHETGHLLAHWHFQDRILAVTLADLDGRGSVWAKGYSDSLIGVRQQMVATAAGPAAAGEVLAGDDLERITSAAKRIVGLAAGPEALQAEIMRAKVAANWLCETYKTEIAAVADLLIQFHRTIENFERHHDGFPA